MLIWIRVPSAAIGIFALLVFATTVECQESTVFDSPREEPSQPAADGNAIEALNITSLPFSYLAQSPCNYSYRPKNRIMESRRASFAVEFFRFLNNYASKYKQDAQKVINDYTISDCATLGLPNLPNTPNVEDLLEMDTGDALGRIYESLIIHTAHAYFIQHQYSNSTGACSESSSHEQRFAEQTLILARKQKSMACTIEISISALGYSQQNTTFLLQERFTNLTQCSRKAIRDCQVARSIESLLDIVAEYAKARS